MGKKALCLIFAFLLSINSFAAVVSDNDGSAFITKAEFDSLKNNFQSQLDQYNSNIDNKIDGAIASYLAGIVAERTENLDSIIYKASKMKAVKFIKDLLAPTTQIGGNAKYGDHIVFSRDSYYSTTTSFHRGGFIQGGGTNYYGMHGYLKLKLAHGGGYYDFLRMTEIAGDASGRNIIFRMNKNSDGRLYTTSKNAYQIIPITVITSYAIGGGVNSHVLTVGPNLDSDIMINAVNSSFYDYSDKDAGMQVTDLGWHKVGMTTTYGDPDNVKVANATSFEETNIITTNGIMLDYLSGGVVDDTKCIYGVLADDWNKCYSTPLQEVSTITYALQWTRFNDGNSNKHEYGSVGIGQKLETVPGSNLGIPNIKMWMKKYNNLKINSLLHDDWTNATGNKILYYNGMPLFTARRDETVKVQISFTNSISSQEGTAYIRDSEFANSDSPSSNVEFWTDKECTIPMVSLSIGTGISKQDRTFYIKAKSGVTYWLKVRPTSNGTILVESPESFEAQYE